MNVLRRLRSKQHCISRSPTTHSQDFLSISIMESGIAGLSLDQRKLIVGIDFGTTFSGIAWAETRRVCVYSRSLTE